MVFIDGGHLRAVCKKVFGHDNINFEKLSKFIVDRFNSLLNNPFQANLIRIYYYDAIVSKKSPEYAKQEGYFESILQELGYTVRLGELVKSSKKKHRQKGVDILMAIDVITKAYQNQYETAIFMLGDRDFVPLINAVKDTGKKTLYLGNPSYYCSNQLLRVFDIRHYLTDDIIKSWSKKS
jgi:uncharacterized LabA/DUF88 family protein